MARRPFFCGRCGKRFSLASKYCPSCGAILSMPVGSRVTGRDGAVHDGDSWSSMRNNILPEILFALALLVALYFGMRNVTANGADKQIQIVTTDKYVDVIDGQPYKLVKKTHIIAENDIDKYPVESVILGLRPEHEKLYPNLSLDQIVKRVADGRIRVQAPARMDNTEKRVKPAASGAARRSRVRLESGVERTEAPLIVLAGTPDLERPMAIRIGRYVEFGSDNRVVRVRDGDIIASKRDLKSSAAQTSE